MNLHDARGDEPTRRQTVTPRAAGWPACQLWWPRRATGLARTHAGPGHSATQRRPLYCRITASRMTQQHLHHCRSMGGLLASSTLLLLIAGCCCASPSADDEDEFVWPADDLVIPLNLVNFDALVGNGSVWVVEFYAPWCVLVPRWPASARQHP